MCREGVGTPAVKSPSAEGAAPMHAFQIIDPIVSALSLPRCCIVLDYFCPARAFSASEELLYTKLICQLVDKIK
jgi:hypothetical protein